MHLPARNGQILRQQIAMLFSDRGDTGERCRDRFLGLGQRLDHHFGCRMAIMLAHFRALEHPGQLPFGVAAKRLDPLGQIVLRG